MSAPLFMSSSFTTFLSPLLNIIISAASSHFVKLACSWNRAAYSAADVRCVRYWTALSAACFSLDTQKILRISFLKASNLVHTCPGFV